MLAMTSVNVDYTFNNAFLSFYNLQAPPPNIAGAGVTYPLLCLSVGLGALITH